MHSSSFESDIKHKDGGEVLVGIAALVTEGRAPGKLNSKAKGFYDGPHCTLSKQTVEHKCDLTDESCVNFENVKDQILNLWHKNIPVCVEVLLMCACKENAASFDQDENQDGFLLEQWYINVTRKRSSETPNINILQLVNAIRSQLYFSQITAWLATQDGKSNFKITKNNLRYRLTLPGETLESSEFLSIAVRHDFPVADIGNGFIVNVSFLSLPRSSTIPDVSCVICKPEKACSIPPKQADRIEAKKKLLESKMYPQCTLKGKHRCEDGEELDSRSSLKGGCCRDRNSFDGPRDAFNSKPHVHIGLKKSSDHLNQEPSPSTSTESCKTKSCHNFEKANFYSLNPYDYQRQKHFNNDAVINNSDSEDEKCDSKERKSRNPKQYKKADVLNHCRCESCTRSYTKSKSNNFLDCHEIDLKKRQNKGQLLLDAIERTARKCTNENCPNVGDRSCDANCFKAINGCTERCDCDHGICDRSVSDITYSIKQHKLNNYIEDDCDSMDVSKWKHKNKFQNVTDKHNDASQRSKPKAVKKLTFDISESSSGATDLDDNYKATEIQINSKCKESNNIKIDIPTPSEQAKFRKYLDSAASMVFHSQTGLPLTSSPAPVRRGNSCFDFDSSINSVSAIKSALYSTSFSTDEESESDGSIISPCSPDNYTVPKRDLSPVKYRRKGHAANLLGSFEESVLNGRLEPVSTVHGFTAELGASGSFVPKHLVCPVTVFFYTLGDQEKVSSPYLGHINLGKKGYNVPKSGTVQVTLFNPLRTVVKMFVIMYDLSDMPPNSQTFMRQRTLFMPTNCKDDNIEWSPKWLRYLIHLRFMSSKSGKIYLHSDIRMIISRKSDMDTATAHGIDMSYELRSFTHMPSNPRFSPRK